jgi:hypothetical protein
MTAKEHNPAPDPFDLESLKSSPLLDLDLERVLTTVPVRRPGRTEFFRVHPDPDYVVDSYVLEYNSGLDRETYWVTGLSPACAHSWWPNCARCGCSHA